MHRAAGHVLCDSTYTDTLSTTVKVRERQPERWLLGRGVRVQREQFQSGRVKVRTPVVVTGT